MKRVNVIALVACWAVFGLSGTAFGDDVIDFDDLKGDNIQVPDGYGGVADGAVGSTTVLTSFPTTPIQPRIASTTTPMVSSGSAMMPSSTALGSPGTTRSNSSCTSMATSFIPAKSSTT